MARFGDTLYCDGCGVEIRAAPVTKGHLSFCCVDCRDGIECDCGRLMDLEDERRGGSALVDADYE